MVVMVIPRGYNTDIIGKPFTISVIEKVWEKARVISDTLMDHTRKDSCGDFIYKREYGKTTEKGWEIDHIKPVSKGGTDDIDNLQPLHWENNRYKDDNFPEWECKKRI